MNTEKQSQKARKLDLNKPFIILIAEETCQHSKQLCQEAAEARERAQEIMHISRFTRQKRKDAINT
jgi:hypothetical protein